MFRAELRKHHTISSGLTNIIFIAIKSHAACCKGVFNIMGKEAKEWVFRGEIVTQILLLK